MTELKQTNPEEAFPQSTRLLQDLLVQRAKIELLEQELATLRFENEQINNDLAKVKRQMEADEETVTKAIGVLGHELELSRAMTAHVKQEAVEQALRHEAEIKETVRRYTC